jgi:hypothetical protein
MVALEMKLELILPMILMIFMLSFTWLLLHHRIFRQEIIESLCANLFCGVIINKWKVEHLVTHSNLCNILALDH